MAIINSYPSVTPTANDLLLICDTSVEGNPTKTASVNSILALIPSGSGGGGISSITSSNSNFLTVTNPDGPLVTLNLQTGFVASGGNTLATTGDIYNFTTTSITNAISNLPVGVTSFACDISNIPAFTSNVTTSTAGSTVLTISRTGGSANQFLDYTGNWSTPSVQGMTSWLITADTGGTDKVEQGEQVNFVGKGKISTEFVDQGGGNYEILITHDATTTTANTTTPTQLTAGGTFTALTTVSPSSDGTGHLEAYNTATYTLPAAGGINSVSVTSPVTNTGTSSDPVIGVDLSSKQDVITLTNTGTSGASTLVGSTLNIPIYSGGGGGSVSSVGLTMPTAFSVANSPVTGSDTLAVTVTGGAAGEFLDYTGNWSTPAGTGTDLTSLPQSTSVLIQSSSGTNASIPEVNVTNNTAGVMTPAQKTRLNSLQVTSNGTALGISPPNTSTNTLTMPWGGTSSQVVLGDGSLQTLSTIPGTYTWTIEGTTGGPTTVASGSAINIAGGTNITTALVGTTLTINSSAGGGSVTDIGVTNGTFTIGSTSTGSDITTSGDISFDLNADGTPDATKFLRGDGSGKWSKLTNGDGVAALTNSTASPTYETTVALEYTGNRNIITAANSATLGDVELTDTVIFNDISQSNKVYKTTLQDVREIVAPVSNIPTYFATELNSSGNAVFANEGNISNNTQGLGGTVSSWTLTKATDNTLEVRFGTAIGSSTYMVNFSIEELTPNPGSKPHYPLATIQNKTKNGFDVQYNKIGSLEYDSSDLSQPVLTNFIIFV